MIYDEHFQFNKNCYTMLLMLFKNYNALLKDFCCTSLEVEVSNLYCFVNGCCRVSKYFINLYDIKTKTQLLIN